MRLPEDMLALPLYARTMGEMPLKGRDIEGMPDGNLARKMKG